MKIDLYKARKVDDGRTFYIGAGKLYDYLSELRTDFFNFDIQRRIVVNSYLDSIGDTVKNNIPFPAITLTTQTAIEDDAPVLDLSKCEILDGLQRTFRLWAIYYSFYLSEVNNELNYKNVYALLNEDEKGKYIIRNNILNTRTLRDLFNIDDAGKRKIDTLIDAFKKYELDLNVWYGLNDEEIVKQMLILNAGHKRVSSVHQFEIIYLHYFDRNRLVIPNGIKILREKDTDYRKIASSTERKKGMFALHSVMIAFQSYYKGSPLRIKGVNEISLNFENSEIDKVFSEVLISSVLSKFLVAIKKIDDKVSEFSGGGHWLAKDTTMSGMFAAFGYNCPDESLLDDYSLIENFAKDITEEELNLSEYRYAHDNLASSRINVGSKVRFSVFNAIVSYKPGKKIDWFKAFGKA